MGDAIHALYVVAHTPGKHDLYITDGRDLHSDGFMYDLERTIEELKPVLLYQDYVRSVQRYEGDVTEATAGEWINLNMWRRYAYSASWTTLLARVFNVPVVAGAWMKWDADKTGKTLVHESEHKARHGNWGLIPYVVGTVDIGNNFESLSALFTMIAGCKYFIGEQSLPLAVAHALDVPRTGVLNEVDAKAYVGEEKIHSRFKYVL